MSYVIVNEDQTHLHSKLSFKSLSQAEEHMEDHGWKHEGDVWIGPSTGSRVRLMERKAFIAKNKEK